MDIFLKVIFLIFFLFATPNYKVYSQKVKVVKLDYVLDLLATNDDTVRIINFWATWCKPCIKELPIFDSLTAAFIGRNVKIILINVDFPINLPKIAAFVKRRGILSETLLLAGGSPKSWIGKITPEWSGSLPATIITVRGRLHELFFDSSITFDGIRDYTEKCIEISNSQ